MSLIDGMRQRQESELLANQAFSDAVNSSQRTVTSAAERCAESFNRSVWSPGMRRSVLPVNLAIESLSFSYMGILEGSHN